jgi:hypothetical protein
LLPAAESPRINILVAVLKCRELNTTIQREVLPMALMTMNKHIKLASNTFTSIDLEFSELMVNFVSNFKINLVI